MAKRLPTMLCLALLLGSSSLLGATYVRGEEAATRRTLLPRRHQHLQAIPTHSDTEDATQWTRTYGGAEDDWAWSVIQTTDGGYAFSGSTGSWPNEKAWLVKTDKNGNVEWTQTYAFSDATTVIQTANGGYVLAGFSGGHIGSYSDAWLVKTDPHGVVQWNRTYNWKDNDEAWSVIQTNDNGFVLGGSSADFNEHWDGWLVKTDADGNLEWTRIYGGPAHDHVNAVIQTVDGGFAFVGDTWSYGAGNADGWLVTTNAMGDLEWNQTYGGSGYDKAYAMIQSVDGNFTLIGTTSSYGSGEFDAWLVRTDVDGNMQWTRTYGGSFHDNTNSVTLTADSGFVLGGTTKSYGASPEDMNCWLVKLNASGYLEWNQTYGGSKDDETNSVIQSADGGFTLAGRTRSFGAGLWDAWLVKTDARGIAPVIDGTTSDWFVIGLLGSLVLATIVVVILFLKTLRRRAKRRY